MEATRPQSRRPASVRHQGRTHCCRREKTDRNGRNTHARTEQQAESHWDQGTQNDRFRNEASRSCHWTWANQDSRRSENHLRMDHHSKGRKKDRLAQLTTWRCPCPELWRPTTPGSVPVPGDRRKNRPRKSAI